MGVLFFFQFVAANGGCFTKTALITAMLPRGNAQITVLKIIVRALDASLVTFWAGTCHLLVLGSHGMTLFPESVVVAAANEPTKRGGEIISGLLWPIRRELRCGVFEDRPPLL